MRLRAGERNLLGVLGACMLALAAGGCARKNVHATPPAAAAPAPSAAATERPMTTAPDTDAVPPVAGATPPAVASTPPGPPPVEMESEIPPAPRRKPGQAPAAEPDAGEQAAPPPSPRIFPQLSERDQSAYRQKTNKDIATAQQNLDRASGRQLSAAQQDLVGKIRSFLAQSLDASKSGDWTRAQNLALKARLLSVELLNSL